MFNVSLVMQERKKVETILESTNFIKRKVQTIFVGYIEEFGITRGALDWLAIQANLISTPMQPQLRKMVPEELQVTHRRGRPRKNKNEEKAKPKPKGKPGRPKSTASKSNTEAKDETDAATAKRKPGRPKGSRNKNTHADQTAQPIVKRGRGRPKGRKNNKTLEKEAQMAALNPPKRGPGRPKGSKNKNPSKSSS